MRRSTLTGAALAALAVLFIASWMGTAGEDKPGGYVETDLVTNRAKPERCEWHRASCQQSECNRGCKPGGCLGHYRGDHRIPDLAVLGVREWEWNGAELRCAQ